MKAVVAELNQAQAVDATNFLSASSASTEALKTASLLKTLSVSAVISGEPGTGKKTLARYILPGAVVKAASDDDVFSTLENNKEVVLTHIEGCSNLKRLAETMKKVGTRVVATVSSSFNPNMIDPLFSVRIHLPPLSERPEDVTMLVDLFADEAQILFNESGDLRPFEPDLSKNAYSLRRQVYFNRLLGSVTENDVMEVMQDFLESRLGSQNDYRKYLYLYEVPLIRSGLKRFGSQLQLSVQLGLNRNTLRKKIAEHEKWIVDSINLKEE